MPKESQKGRLGPVGPECQKSVEKVEKVEKERLLRDFSDFFGTFLALRADRAGKTFLRLFGHFGPGTPCNWRLQSQSYGPPEALFRWLAYCRTNWRCTAVLFRQVVGGWGVRNIAQFPESEADRWMSDNRAPGSIRRWQFPWATKFFQISSERAPSIPAASGMHSGPLERDWRYSSFVRCEARIALLFVLYILHLSISLLFWSNNRPLGPLSTQTAIAERKETKQKIENTGS